MCEWQYGWGNGGWDIDQCACVWDCVGCGRGLRHNKRQKMIRNSVKYGQHCGAGGGKVPKESGYQAWGLGAERSAWLSVSMGIEGNMLGMNGVGRLGMGTCGAAARSAGACVRGTRSGMAGTCGATRDGGRAGRWGGMGVWSWGQGGEGPQVRSVGGLVRVGMGLGSRGACVGGRASTRGGGEEGGPPGIGCPPETP